MLTEDSIEAGSILGVGVEEFREEGDLSNVRSDDSDVLST